MIVLMGRKQKEKLFWRWRGDRQWVGLLFYKERGHFDDLSWLGIPSQIDRGDPGLWGLLRNFTNKLRRKGGREEKIAGCMFVVHQELGMSLV
jgi:hypothetical protein